MMAAAGMAAWTKEDETMKRYGFSTEIRATSDTGMVLAGRAIVYDKPTVLYRAGGVDYKEQIDSHALESADLSDVVLRYNHSNGFTVFARTRNRSLQLEQRPDGLYMTANLQSDIQQHRDIHSLVKSGLVDKMSFAFAAADNGDEYDRGTHTRTVTNIRKLFDLSVVDQPAYDQTFVEARNQTEQYIDQVVNLEDYRESTRIKIYLLRRTIS